MSLEATVVVVDNSEHTRSGDYAPTRFQAQQDAVNLLAGAKTQANPENTVGVLTMAGKTPRVLVTPTPDLGKVLNSMASLDIEGHANFAAAVQIAQLALKHRQNKNQRQRIVIFVGSPLAESQKDLVRIAKKLKKNNVAVDVVSFGGEGTDNEEKLTAFIEAVNSSDNSHLVAVPAGTILSDQLFGSPIYQQDGGAGYAAGGGGAAEGGEAGGGFEFGVDANLDPELALALRVSLEEERARQQATGGEGQPAEGAAAGEGATADGAGAAAVGGGAEPMDEDALLQQALAMSMDVNAPAAGDATGAAAADVAATPAASAAPAATPSAPERAPAPPPLQPQQPPERQPLLGGDTNMAEEVDDPELAAALAMSMADFAGDSAAPAASEAPPAATSAPATSTPQSTPAGEGGASSGVANLLGDAEYLRSVLGSLPGVDPNDPALQSTLRDLQGGGSKEEKAEGKEEKKEGDKE